MEKKIIEFYQAQRATKAVPDLQSGDVVKVFLKIKEGEKETGKETVESKRLDSTIGRFAPWDTIHHQLSTLFFTKAL